jgi:hypothetical protein
MTTTERNREWLPFKLFIISAALLAAGWIMLVVVMALWPM